MAAADKMPEDIEAEIRELPGNDTCVDCKNQQPQWASVTYGTLVCLECSGQHRSLGTHLSFVRSVQMDSWKPQQIEAMRKSGGNAATIEYFSSRGIDQSMPVAQKYNTKQAEYLKNRLARRLEGKTEPPPDPGNYDPVNGGDAQGAEPLPGESTEEYNARQARLREAARERLRAKFGQGGLGSASCGSPEEASGLGGVASGAVGAAVGAVGAVGGVVGGAVTGAGSLIKSSVLENEQLHTKLKGAGGYVAGTATGALETLKAADVGTTVKSAGGYVTDTATGAWGALRKSVADGDVGDKVFSSLKRNAAAEEGSVVSKGWGWTKGAMGGIGGLLKQAASAAGEVIASENDGSSKPPPGPRCNEGHTLRTEPNSGAVCSRCPQKGTRYACSQGCDFSMCIKCYEKPQTAAGTAASGKSGGNIDFDNDDWGEDDAQGHEPPPEPTEDDMARLAKELGMSLGGDDKKPAPDPVAAAVAAPALKAVSAPAPKAEAAAKAAAKPKADETDEDFFAAFGM
eukprot:TRINITY_DN100812_c0_g1_i1.p1 TRINITY_DN100812_c0_g1~~TRINITY_DN100812_c0_g1_i1.p1  ORF type:complete len:548 (-),score=148.32 TRINITY_DN100812_c0_g1_i1:60-1601(-)